MPVEEAFSDLAVRHIFALSMEHSILPIPYVVAVLPVNRHSVAAVLAVLELSLEDSSIAGYQSTNAVVLVFFVHLAPIDELIAVFRYYFVFLDDSKL